MEEKLKFDLTEEQAKFDNRHSSPASTGINDGYLIERHKLRQTDLEEMIGVDGYDDEAIRQVLESYGRGGLQEWLIVDSTKAQAEGRSTTAVMQNSEHLIDALQFWGMVSGQMLRDWGLSEEEVPDIAKQYPCEAWLIGQYGAKPLAFILSYWANRSSKVA